MPTDLEKAAALRAAADFCEDPRSPKVHGQLCRGLRGEVTALPWDEHATHWCAIGYAFKQVGNQWEIPGCGNIAVAFDNHNYARAARELRAVARGFEERIPVTREVAIPQEVPA